MQQRGNLQRRRVDAGLAGQGHYLVGQAFRSLQMLAHFDSSAAVLEAVRAVWAERSDPMLTVNPEQGWVVDLPGVDHGRDGVADAIQHSTTSAGRPPTRSGTAG